MAELTYSRFGDDFRTLIEGITLAIKTAWPDVPKVYADRNLIEDANRPRAVIVPVALDYSKGQGVSTVRTVAQVYQFSIFLVESITQSMDVIERKATRADALIYELMKNDRFLNVFMEPMITAVGLAEEEPDPKQSVLRVDFTCYTENWRHGAV